jgi:hypothetical protein
MGWPPGSLVHLLDLPAFPGFCGCAALPKQLRHYHEGWEKAEWCDLTKRLCKPKREDA